jgi:septal ring factor EnvC (AmiA/AmiB activator)
MWELLMQLRVLLPYLARLVPLLDRGLVKAAPDLSEVRKGIEAVHSGNRDLGVQLRNQAGQMERLAVQTERLEEQVSRLREANERLQKEMRDLSAELRSVGKWSKPLFIVSAITMLALLALGVFLVTKSGP